MQEEIQRLLNGPKPVRGYYFDSSINRYFPVPKSGSLGYPRYQQLREMYEKQVLSELSSKTQHQVETIKSSIRNVYDAIWDIRSGYARGGPSESLFTLRKVALTDAMAQNISIVWNQESRHLSLPTHPEQLLIAGNRFLYTLCTVSLRQGDPIPHGKTNISDFKYSPDYRSLSLSSLDGSLSFRSAYDLSEEELATFPIKSSIWTHEWISNDSIFCGCDNSGAIFNARTGRTKKVYSEKSSIFAASTVCGSEQEILFGTRSGKLFLYDGRTGQSTSLLGIKGSKKSPYRQLQSLQSSHYVIGSHSDGRIELMDLRMTAPVMAWRSNSSVSDASYRFCLNNEQSILATHEKTSVQFFGVYRPTEVPLSTVDLTDPILDLVWSDEWSSRRYPGFGVALEEGLQILEFPF